MNESPVTVSKRMAHQRLLSGAVIGVLGVAVALVAGCSQPAPPPPAPAEMAPAPSPPPPPAPPARG